MLGIKLRACWANLKVAKCLVCSDAAFDRDCDVATLIHGEPALPRLSLQTVPKEPQQRVVIVKFMVYICICVCVYVCVYIYVYTYNAYISHAVYICVCYATPGTDSLRNG